MKKIKIKNKNNEDKKAKGFQISHFHWSFSSDITEVKGLNKNLLKTKYAMNGHGLANKLAAL